MRYTAQQIKDLSVSTSTRDGQYIPARSEYVNTVQSAWRRVKNAWGVLIGKYDALDWEEHRYGMPNRHHHKCNVPPEGWKCSRQAGHEGPCAATPIDTPPIREYPSAFGRD